MLKTIECQEGDIWRVRSGQLVLISHNVSPELAARAMANGVRPGDYVSPVAYDHGGVYCGVFGSMSDHRLDLMALVTNVSGREYRAYWGPLGAAARLLGNEDGWVNTRVLEEQNSFRAWTPKARKPKATLKAKIKAKIGRRR